LKPPRGVPRDEWLLAIGLASYFEAHRIGSPLAVVIADCISGDGSGWLSARNGASCVKYGPACLQSPTTSDVDCYAAGAALAMALEEP
jgi:hypothetical protein